MILNETNNLIFKINLNEYRRELDEYRLPLETYSFSESLEKSKPWLNRILTLSEFRIDEKLWKFLESSVNCRQFPNVESLVHEQTSNIEKHVQFQKESYVLLLQLLQFRIQLDKFPEQRNVIQRNAEEFTLKFLRSLYNLTLVQSVYRPSHHLKSRLLTTVITNSFVVAALLYFINPICPWHPRNPFDLKNQEGLKHESEWLTVLKNEEVFKGLERVVKDLSSPLYNIIESKLEKDWLPILKKEGGLKCLEQIAKDLHFPIINEAKYKEIFDIGNSFINNYQINLSANTQENSPCLPDETFCIE